MHLQARPLYGLRPYRHAMSTIDGNSGKGLRDLSTISTLVDAALAFYRGRIKSGLLLVGAAIASRKAPGLGTAASLLLRIVRRLR